MLTPSSVAKWTDVAFVEVSPLNNQGFYSRSSLLYLAYGLQLTRQRHFLSGSAVVAPAGKSPCRQ